MASEFASPELLSQSLLFARFSAAAYSNESARLVPQLSKFANEFRLSEANTSNKTNTQALLGRWNDDVVVAFRGTEQNLTDWWTDLNGQLVTSSADAGQVHRGFRDALDSVYARVRQFVRDVQVKDKSRLFICGHSLGGALAQLAARRLAKETNLPKVRGVFTYGAPRVGDQVYVDDYRASPVGNLTTLWVAKGDPITRVAPHAFEYRHVVPRQLMLDEGHINVTNLDSAEELRREQDWLGASAVGRTLRWLSDRLTEIATKLDMDEHSIEHSYIPQLEQAQAKR